MGVDYDAKAGYGISVLNNLTEEGQDLLDNKYDGEIEEFLNEEVSDLYYTTIGCSYSGDTELMIYIDDPLEFKGKYKKFYDRLQNYKHLFNNTEPQWFCELYIW